MDRIKFKDILFYILVWGAVGLLAAIAFISIFKSSPGALKIPWYTGIAFFALASGVIVLIYKLNLISRMNPFLFLVILILLTVIPRVAWTYFIQTQPFSDFLHLHNYGINVSRGDFTGFVDFYGVFPFKIGFGMVLGALYFIFGSGLMVTNIFNIVLAVILVLILYTGGRTLYSEKAGRLAGLLTAIWPAHIMYTSVIASEDLFLVLFTAAVVLMLTFLKKYTHKNYEIGNGNLIMIGAGILTALAQVIRPMAMILLPVFAVFVLIFNRYRADRLSDIGLRIKAVLVVTLTYVIVLNLINIPIQNASGVDITRSGSGFNLLVGTNSKADGMFNNEDFAIIKKYNYDFDKVHHASKEIALERVKSSPVQFVKLAIRKFEILWGNENFGYYWSTQSAGDSGAEKLVKSHPRVFYAVSQAFYILILLMAICACIYNLSEKRYDALIILMVFGGIVVSYLLLEVQSRYHLPVMPLLILFGTSFLELSKRYEV